EHWDYPSEPQLAKIPIKSYTVFIPFTLQNQEVKILTAQRLNVTIYPNQFETLGGSIEETDKGIFEAAKRECKEETSYKPDDKRMQLILNHQYLSNNKNGTKLFVQGLHEYTQIEKRIQIYTFLYYVYPKEYPNFINNEPDKASTRKWMTLSEMKHELFIPTIHYYKKEIFKKYIPAYWEEFTRKGR
ncbi:908_t:CDS:1, partial [Gigaspora margarita]